MASPTICCSSCDAEIKRQRVSGAKHEEVLNKKECSECKKEIEAVKAKIEEFESKQDGILGALKEPTMNIKKQ